MKKTIQFAIFLFVLVFINSGFAQSSSLVISFGNLETLDNLAALLEKNNISYYFQEIIECKNDPYPCDAKADCKDVMYTFECTCQKGYTVEPDFTKLSNETCVDINECENEEDYNCTLNSSCYNNEGSYDCLCDDGFISNGDICQDINECDKGGSSDCSINAECFNTEGSYYCQCNDGYKGDGIICLKAHEDCLFSACYEPDSLSCEYEKANELKARRIFESYRYFFSVSNFDIDLCPAEANNSLVEITAMEKSDPISLLRKSEVIKICDVKTKLSYRTFAYMDEERKEKVEIFHFKRNFQWFETRTCEEAYEGDGPIGCVQRYLPQKALVIEKNEGKFQFDVKFVYLESGCEVDVFA